MTEVEATVYFDFFALAGQLADDTIDAVLADLPSCDCLPFVTWARRAFDDRRNGRGLTLWREADEGTKAGPDRDQNRTGVIGAHEP